MRTNGIITAAALAGAVLAGCSKKEQGENEAAKPAVAAAPAGTPMTAAIPTEAPDSLRALAKLTVDSAARLAIAQVAGGTIEKAELEREKGTIIWSFDIRVPGQEGISEVNVNATTGAVSPTEHENAAAEAREAREDSAHARHPAAPARAATPTTKRP